MELSPPPTRHILGVLWLNRAPKTGRWGSRRLVICQESGDDRWKAGWVRGEKKTNVCLGRRAHGWEARGPQSLLSAWSLIGKSSSWYFISFLYWIYKGFVLHQCAVCIQDLKPLEVEQGAPSGVDPEQRRPGVLVLTDPSWDELWKFARPRRALVEKNKIIIIILVLKWNQRTL